VREFCQSAGLAIEEDTAFRRLNATIVPVGCRLTARCVSIGRLRDRAASSRVARARGARSQSADPAVCRGLCGKLREAGCTEAEIAEITAAGLAS
jgi:hypothetical protein